MDCPLHDGLLHVRYNGMLLNEERRVFYDTRVDNNDQPLEFSSGEGLVSVCREFMLSFNFFQSIEAQIIISINQPPMPHCTNLTKLL